MRADSFKDFVLDQLGRVPQLMCKAMFGGYGLYRNGTFFGIIHKGRLYFKVSPKTITFYKQHGMKPFRPNVKQTLKTYYEVPVEVMEDAARLTVWGQQAATETAVFEKD